MDTLSRDSSSGSSNIVPMAGLFAAVLALILAIVALVKLSSLQKVVTAQGDEVAKIGTLESEVRSTATKVDGDIKVLRDGVQKALTDVGTEFGNVNARITKLEEAAKKAPAPAAAGTKGGAAAPTGGKLDANGNYVVGKGDSLFAIARKFGVKVDAIEAENPGLDARSMKPGQKIKIPKR